jgi:hypothetical protein
MRELFSSRGPSSFSLHLDCSYSYSTAFWGGSGSWVSLTCSEDRGSGATPRSTFRWFQLHESGFGQGGKGGKGGKGERIGDACEILNEPNELQEEIG